MNRAIDDAAELTDFAGLVLELAALKGFSLFGQTTCVKIISRQCTEYAQNAYNLIANWVAELLFSKALLQGDVYAAPSNLS